MAMLHETKAVISGSQIVQFFDRKAFIGSDMDIYVSGTSALVTGNWLEKNGFKYIGSYGVYGSHALEESIIRSVSRKKCLSGLTTGNSIVGVFNFKKQDRHVQVIVLEIDPLKHILFEFHSSESF